MFRKQQYTWGALSVGSLKPAADLPVSSFVFPAGRMQKWVRITHYQHFQVFLRRKSSLRSAGNVTAICLKEYFKRTGHAQNIIQDIKASCLPTVPFKSVFAIPYYISKTMRLPFVLAVVAACKSASSLPISDENQCEIGSCAFSSCCPGYSCEAISADFWIVVFLCVVDNGD